MLCRINNFLFNAMAVKEFLIFSGCFFVLTAIAMYSTDSLVRPAGCPGVVSLELAFTKSAFLGMTGKCGAEGVRAYVILNWIDYLFIIGYAGFLANLLGALVKGLERGRALTLFSIPIIAGLLDVIENTIFLTQLSNPESASGIAIFLASTAAAVKFALIAVTIALVIYYLYAAATKKKEPAT